MVIQPLSTLLIKPNFRLNLAECAKIVIPSAHALVSRPLVKNSDNSGYELVNMLGATVRLEVIQKTALLGTARLLRNVLSPKAIKR